MVRSTFIALFLLGAGCAGSAWHDDYERLRGESDALPALRAPEAPSADADLDRALAQPLDLSSLLTLARARNPELREAAYRTRAGLEEVRRAGSLDDPMLKLG